MSEIKCADCGKQFSFESRLARHLNKKTSCKPRLELAAEDAQHACKYCNRTFSNKQNLNRHCKYQCAIAIGGVDKLAEIMNVSKDRTQQLNTEVNTEVNIGGQGNINGNTSNGAGRDNNIVNGNENVMHNTITVNLFGQEDFSKINNECIFERILKSDQMFDAWMEIVSMCYGQEKNRTIYIKDRRRVKVLVSIGEGIWKEMPLKDMQTRCLEVSRELLYERRGHVDAGRWTPMQELEKVLQHLFDIVNCDDVTEEVLKQTLNSFKGVLLENRDYLKKTNAIRREVKDPSETLGDKQ